MLPSVIISAIMKNPHLIADHKSSNPFIASRPISIIPYGIRGRNARPNARGVRQMTADDITLTSGG